MTGFMSYICDLEEIQFWGPASQEPSYWLNSRALCWKASVSYFQLHLCGSTLVCLRYIICKPIWINDCHISHVQLLRVRCLGENNPFWEPLIKYRRWVNLDLCTANSHSICSISLYNCGMGEEARGDCSAYRLRGVQYRSMRTRSKSFQQKENPVCLSKSPRIQVISAAPPDRPF